MSVYGINVSPSVILSKQNEMKMKIYFCKTDIPIWCFLIMLYMFYCSVYLVSVWCHCHRSRPTWWCGVQEGNIVPAQRVCVDESG